MNERHANTPERTERGGHNSEPNEPVAGRNHGDHEPRLARTTAAASGPGDAAPGHERDSRPHPAIYVADLAAYVSGRLHGVWLDAAREPSAIHADIQAMLAASPENVPGVSVAEEFAIHDYEQFGNCELHEYDSIELVAAIARGIAEHGYAFAAWADANEGELDEGGSDEAAGLGAQFEAAYLGHYESLEAYIQQQLDERGAEAELSRLLDGSGLLDLAGYITIDVAALASDLYLSGEVQVYRVAAGLGDGVWLFGEGDADPGSGASEEPGQRAMGTGSAPEPKAWSE